MLDVSHSSTKIHKRKRNRDLVGSTVLSKGPTRERHWEAWETVDHQECWGNHIRKLHSLVTGGRYLGHVLA